MQEDIKIKDEIFFGKNTVFDIIKNNPVSKVFLQKGFKDKEIQYMLKEKNIPFVLVDKYKLDKITKNKNHQGIVAYVSPVEYASVDGLINKSKNKKNPIIFIFDELTDPHNLGAILRISDAFDIDGIIISKKRNVQLNSTVAKVGAGSIFHVDVARVPNIKNSIMTLKKAGYWIAYLDMDGESKLDTVKFDVPMAVVIGGEDKGVTNVMKKHCDYGINIPMSGKINSLNVASATSIIAYQYSIKK